MQNYNNMTTTSGEIIGQIIAIIVMAIVGFAIANALSNYRDTLNAETLADYDECKTLTTNLEWCFKHFKPNLK